MAQGLLIGSLALSSQPGVATASPGQLVTEVQEFLGSQRVKGLRFAMEFLPLESGDRRASVSVAGETPLIPASVTKLVTAVAALETLGPSYTFGTEVHRNGPLLADGTLDGDLAFLGSGDPYLTSERLWLLAHQLRTAGLRRVEGNLVIYVSGFPLEDTSALRSLGDTDRSYAARPSGVAANFNCLTLLVAAGDSPGGAPKVSGDPYDLDYLTVDASGFRTGPPGGRVDWSLALEPTDEGRRYDDWVARIQSAATDSGGIDPVFTLPSTALETARIRGVLPVGLGPETAYRRARYPLPMVGHLLRAALSEFEIEVVGSIRIDTRAPSGRPWIEFPSPSLVDIVESMNRYSSNFIANQLALAVHRERWGGPAGTVAHPPDGSGVPPAGEGASSGSPGRELPASASTTTLRLEDAGHSLVAWLSEALPGASKGCDLYDGSGLSVDNRLTATALTKLLAHAWDDLRIQPKLMASLPGPGEPGTLRSRFRNGDRPVLWAKTGTLSDTGVCSLAGYFEDRDGGVVAFSMLLNADSGSHWTVPAMQALQEHWIEVYRN